MDNWDYGSHDNYSSLRCPQRLRRQKTNYTFQYSLDSVSGNIYFSNNFADILPHANYIVLNDLFRKEPLGASIACKDRQTLKELVVLFNTRNLSIQPTTDLIGVEYACSFKNVVSILAGIVNGIGFSYGSQSYTISRAASEVEDLVVGRLGGRRKTFSVGSQCWGNDLWMSCTGNTRNREFGRLLGMGYSIDKAIDKMKKAKKIVEGIYTIKVLNKIADLTKYPLLDYLYKFFRKEKKVEDIKEIIFNHNL